jgi:hypothetical protein
VSFRSWLKRSLGRTAEGSKVHLVATAQLLGFDHRTLDQMNASTDEDCETLFIASIQGSHGAVVDWKTSLENLIEEVTCLTAEERASLDAAPPTLATPRIYRTSHQITRILRAPLRALRVLESLGDAYIIILVPRPSVEDFDRINKNWMI